MKSFSGLLFMTVLLSGCAIRQNLDSVAFHPVNKPQTQDGSVDKDASKGTKYCRPASDGTFNEDVIDPQTGAASDGVAWAEGGGCVARPIREVWAVLNNLELMKFNDIDRSSSERQIHPTPEFTHLYTTTYYKNTPIGSINFTLQWYHGVGQGTFAAPEQVNIAYQRTRGTSMIPIWHGGIGLIKVNDHVTSVSIRNDFLSRALSVSANIVKAHDALTEMIGKARSGTPDWARLDEGLTGQPTPTPTPTASATPAQY